MQVNVDDRSRKMGVTKLLLTPLQRLVWLDQDSFREKDQFKALLGTS